MSCPEQIPGRLLLQWHLTERCNLRCRHCYQSGCPASEMDTAQLWTVVEQFREWLIAQNPSRPRGQINLTGGEPLLHPGFRDLVSRLASAWPELSYAVLTNGTLVNAKWAGFFRDTRAAYVQVSIEGTRETHEQIRGPGSYQRAVDGLSALARAGVPALISFTAHGENFREFPAVARLGSELGVHAVWSDRLIPEGSGSALKTLTAEQTREYLRILRQARDEVHRRRGNRTEVRLHRALQFLAGGGPPYRCTAGETLLTVMPDGTVYPCRRMPLAVGCIQQTRLADIWRSNPLLCKLRDPAATGERCGGCACRSLCRGGLRCLAQAVHGDPLATDPGCWVANERTRPERAREYQRPSA